MFNFPRHLIFPDKLYIFSVLYQSEVGRAVERDLIDYRVELKNPKSESDKHQTLLGLAKNLSLGYRERVPLEWLLCRFLCDYVRSNSLHLLDGKNGEILSFKNYKKYLGQPTTSEEVKSVLGNIFTSWIQTFPNETPNWSAIFVSSISIPEDTLKRGLDSLGMKIPSGK